MTKKTKTGEPTQRMLRVGEEIRHIMAETLRRGAFDDAVLFESSNNVTVTRVTVSPDLRYATAYVMPLGGVNVDEIIDALNESTWLFQQDIGKGLKMRSTPKVRFTMDDSFDRVDNIERLLRQVGKDLD